MKYQNMACMFAMGAVSGCGMLDAFAPAAEPAIRIRTQPMQSRDVKWRGWSAIEQTNGLITLRHVPDAGGRTLSLEMNGQDHFLVFPEEQGRTYPAGSRDNSVHFGGHYTCIGPERVWNVSEQPFNPHAGPCRVQRRTADPDRHQLFFASRPGTWRGATIAIERAITMHRGNTHVIIDERVINCGDEPLEFYIWDFTQIDACDRRRPDRPLRNLSVYLPVPRKDGRKQYTSFIRPGEPEMLAQFDESLPADVLAIHYHARQFKVASHADAWWVAVVDHDTGWTYIKAFEPDRGARYVDENGPIEVYGANRDAPLGGSFLELELLTGLRQYAPGQGPTQREHWYATTCGGPVLDLTTAGVVCEPLEAVRDGACRDVRGRFGVFHLGVARLQLIDGKGDVRFTGEPTLVDPRQEFTLSATVPVESGEAMIVLKVFDHEDLPVGELGRVRP